MSICGNIYVAVVVDVPYTFIRNRTFGAGFAQFTRTFDLQSTPTEYILQLMYGLMNA